MKNLVLMAMVAMAAIVVTGCNSVADAAMASAGDKNLGVDGYFLYGKLESANPETATPQGTMLLGRASYKSRKVSIPADQKVPNTGSFRATISKNLFGAEELIVEYDYTAGSDKDAKMAMEAMEKKREEVMKITQTKAATGQNTDEKTSE